MLRIRKIEPEDIARLKEIHEEFYAGEFPFPDLIKNTLGAFIIEDDEDGIVSGGSIRLLPELVAISNKNILLEKKMRAYKEIMQFAQYVCASNNLESIHAWVLDNKWSKHLKKMGFIPCNGESLHHPFLGVTYGEGRLQ